MATTIEELRRLDAWRELTRLFGNPTSGQGTTNDANGQELLSQFGFPSSRLPNFPDPRAFWGSVCQTISDGAFHDRTLDDLLRFAADVFPGNPAFARWRADASKPGERVGMSILVQGHPNLRDLLQLMQTLCTELGFTGQQQIVHSEGNVSINFDESAANGGRLARALAERLKQLGVPAHVELHPFRDYLFTNLHGEGPDGRRYVLEDVPASTPVSHVAQAVMSNYTPEIALGADGKGQQTTVDIRDEAGNVRRVDSGKTLHESGVQEGQTLEVAPQRTAGSVNPLIRDEALARARSQVVAFAEGHPGFEIEANARHAPTEYVFRFEIQSFAPPLSAGESPVEIWQHEVILLLPSDFPMVAPRVHWLTPIFHPNVEPKSGRVCLGMLEDGYRPGLDFGELCQLLIDLAGYRNYEVREGYNLAAQEWAISEEGLSAIDGIGGLSLWQAFLQEQRPPRSLKIRPFTTTN